MYTSPLLVNRPGLTHGFSGISDGNQDFRFGEHQEVLDNRLRFLHGIGLALDDCVQQQGLGDVIKVVTADERGAGMRDVASRIYANAFITNQAGVGLFLCVADCLPIIIYDPRHEVVALLHAARESTNRKLATKVVERMNSEFGCAPGDLLVAFGPAVRAESYVFDEGIYKLVGPEWEPYLTVEAPGRIKVDYVAYNRTQLLATGVQSQHLLDPGIDTGQDDEYFSHAQAVRTGRPEGRIAAAVALR